MSQTTDLHIPIEDPSLKSRMKRDQIYSLPLHQVGDFEFDARVVEVFQDMVARSVPGYASILSLIEQLTERFVRPGSNVYDLGCSLGACARLIRQRAPQDCVIHAIDNAPAMISQLRKLLAADSSPGCRVLVQEADLRDVRIDRASFVVLNLTLQFISPTERSAVLQRIGNGMLPGGALVLSEKVCFDDPQQQALMTELHHDFKRAHGYTDLEIAQKRTAIENRLIPESLECHRLRLRQAGFDLVAPWFQCFSFVSILAVKSAAAAELSDSGGTMSLSEAVRSDSDP